MRPTVLNTTKIAVPVYIWLVALVLGVLIAAASLSYSPQGRINVLWVWLLWAALPLLGSLVSLGFAVFGSARPWLFQWRDKSINWYPSASQRLQMLWLLQLFWCVVAAGMLVGYLMLLLFSDLAFGWSSTLITGDAATARWAEIAAAPWRAIWPEAMPSAELIASTRFQRISPEASEAAMAGHWWRFLMASLVFYNLLPRALLALVFYGRWRWQMQPQLQVKTATPPQHQPASSGAVRLDSPENWHDATPVGWELDIPGTLPNLGLKDWQHDEARLKDILAQRPQRLLWRVSAVRSPVAELSDLMGQARAAGVKDQALWPQQNDQADPARHLGSWRAFAQQHQLTWISND